MKTFRIFRVEFDASENDLDAKITITDLSRGECKSITADYSTHMCDQAMAHLQAIGIEVLGEGYDEDGYYFVSENLHSVLMS